MDVGGYEIMKVLEVGVDIIIVLGVIDDVMIKGVVEEVKKQKKKILVDMINVKDIEFCVKEIDVFGVDYICVYIGYDF